MVCSMKAAIGRVELLKHRKGERLTHYEMIKAKCYECMEGYEDGMVDCKVSCCPHYGRTPYRDGQEDA